MKNIFLLTLATFLLADNNLYSFSKSFYENTRSVYIDTKGEDKHIKKIDSFLAKYDKTITKLFDNNSSLEKVQKR